MIRAIAIAAALLWVAPLAAQFGRQPASFDATPSTEMVPVSSGRALAGSVETSGHAPLRQSLARNEKGTFWDFAPDAPHQAAAVHVKADGTPFAGSGTLVGTTGKITLVVTNHHVVETNGMNVTQTITATMRDGTKLKGRLLGATPREDVAVYAVDRTDLPCVAVSSENAPAGAMIEVMGFGGPRRGIQDFRPFRARTVEPVLGALAIDAPTISGDSGSGMIWDGVLVGVNFGGPGIPTTAGVNGGEGVGLVYPSSSHADAEFLNRFLTQQCQPQGCQPLIGRPGWLIPRGDQLWDRKPRPPQGQFPGPEQFYRPPDQQPSQPPQQQPPSGYTPPNTPDQQQTPPPQQQPPSLDPPANSPACDCDDERIIAILAELKKPGEQGPKGDQGTQGERGPAGPPGEVTEEQIKDAVAAIYSQMKLDPSFKGPKGDPGKDAEVDLDALADLVAEKLGPHPSITIAIADGQRGVIVEQETYAPGETIVLDMQTIIKAALASRQ